MINAFRIYVSVILLIITLLLATIVGGLLYADRHLQTKVVYLQDKVNGLNTQLNNLNSDLLNINNQLKEDKSVPLPF